jgi:hypothetical protein
MILTRLILLATLCVAQARAAEPGTVPVFLGPVPSAEGFVQPAGRFADSYRDLREEFQKDKSFKSVIRLVEDAREAVLVIEVSDRSLKDTGIRTGNAVSTSNTTAVGTSRPVMLKQLYARMAVIGSSYTLEIDGAAGLHHHTYRNEAKNVIQQVVDWVKANRSKLIVK